MALTSLSPNVAGTPLPNTPTSGDYFRYQGPDGKVTAETREIVMRYRQIARAYRFRVIIAGSRDIADRRILEAALQACPWSDEITEVVCGEQRGVDTLGKEWAEAQGLSVKPFPADWDTYGKAAGPIRNAQMAAYADGLIAIPGPRSKGTYDMINKAKSRGLAVYVYRGHLR